MYRLFQVVFLLCIPLSLISQIIEVPKKALRQINAKELKQSLSVLTSDSLEGRDTGSLGGEKAATFIENQFRTLGLEPLANQSYRQSFTLWKSNWSRPYAKVNGVQLDGNTQIDYLGYVPLNDTLLHDIIFFGNGMDSSYQTVDVSNKIVFVLSSDMKKTYSVTSPLEKRGAWGVFMVNSEDTTQFNSITEKQSQFRSAMNVSKIKPSVREIGTKLFVLPTNITTLFFNKTIDELKSMTPHEVIQQPLTAQVLLSCSQAIEPIQVDNIIGVLKGTDKSDSIVAITAHYDHIGRKASGICRWADDNGSGVSTILEVARVFEKMKQIPKNDIWFIAFTGEEMGLLGSADFMDKMSETAFKANINVDMIGRHDTLSKNNYVYILGTDQSPWLHALHQQANKQSVKLKLDYEYNNSNSNSSFIRRSDHYQFYKNKIPVIAFFSGLHGDYHTPADTMDKIDFPLFEKRVKLVYSTAYLISNGWKIEESK